MGSQWSATAATTQERLQQHELEVNRGIRQLRRQRAHEELNRDDLIQSMKQTASRGDVRTAKEIAKNVVNSRKMIERFGRMEQKLRQMATIQVTALTQQQAALTMYNTAKILTAFNTVINLPRMNRKAREFEAELAKLNMKDDLLGDSLETIFAEEEDEDESDMMLNQVLDEFNIPVMTLPSATSKLNTTGQLLPSMPNAPLHHQPG